MTDKERIVEVLKAYTKKNNISASVVILEEYAEELIANGVILPPCKVGDTVYVIKYCRCGNPEAFEMKHCHKKNTKKTPKVFGSVMLRQDGRRYIPNSYKFDKPQWEWKPVGTICYKIIQKPFKLEWLTEVGKTVFLTKEEAEAELQKRGVSNAR